MANIESAALCPIRIKDGNLETLLVRRAFWNKKRNRPMLFPGEWTFAGGKRELDDIDLLETAVREFREELSYEKKVENIRYLREGVSADRYDITFYTASINGDLCLTDEVIDLEWMRPRDARKWMLSEQFNSEIYEEYRARDIELMRVVPAQTIRTLSCMEENEDELIRIY